MINGCSCHQKLNNMHTCMFADVAINLKLMCMAV